MHQGRQRAKKTAPYPTGHKEINAEAQIEETEPLELAAQILAQAYLGGLVLINLLLLIGIVALFAKLLSR